MGYRNEIQTSTRWNVRLTKQSMAHSLHRIGLAPVSAFAEHCYNYIYTVEGGSHLLFQVKQTGELKHRQMLHDSPMTRKTYKKKPVSDRKHNENKCK